MKSVNGCHSSHMCKNHSQNFTRRSEPSLIAWNILGTEGFVFVCCEMRLALILGTPASREHCLKDLSVDCVTACNTVVTLLLLVKLRHLPDRPKLILCIVPSVQRLSRSPAIIRSGGGNIVPNLFV
jgi:hypothetical protein